ncbi:MAG: serine/threonine-protein kinase, partial [Vicinamibacteria bacterium]
MGSGNSGLGGALGELTKSAGGWLIGLGVLSMLLGLVVSMTSGRPGLSSVLYVTGGIYLATGYFTRRGSFIALVLGSGYFLLNVLLDLATASVLVTAVRIGVLIPMVRAVRAHYLERKARSVREAGEVLAIGQPLVFAETVAPKVAPGGGAGPVGQGNRSPPGRVFAETIAPVKKKAGVEVGATGSDQSEGGSGASPIQTLGPYTVTGVLGTGGMATVYRARQMSVGRDVALKVINVGGSSDPEFSERFRREAETTARLSHPHILKVFDFGEDAGRPYLSMELMGGGTLRSRIRGTTLSVPQIVKWAEQVGGALGAAHGAGVVHRDVKPENVLLDVGGNAFLADFGLARLSNVQGNLTQAGVQMGSPSYMSPEQWHGSDVTSASDLYAFAVMLFELFAGVPP